MTSVMGFQLNQLQTSFKFYFQTGYTFIANRWNDVVENARCSHFCFLAGTLSIVVCLVAERDCFLMPCPEHQLPTDETKNSQTIYTLHCMW